MRKLLLLICLLPFAGVAQESVVASKYPTSLPTTFFENKQQLNSIPGVDKQRLLVVLKQWFDTKFEIADTVGVTQNEYTLLGTGLFHGSFTYHGDSFGKQNIAPVEYDVKFTIRVKVSDEKYEISISDFKLNITSVTGQDPKFLGYLSTTPYVSNSQFKTNLNDLYTNIREHISLSEVALFKNASKYITKAQKKGLL